MLVYKSTNKVNGKIYIGITTLTLEGRKYAHFKDSTRKDRPLVYFHKAIAKYGKENFTFEIIEEAQNIDELNEREKFWIDYFNSTNRKIGYNLDSGGKCYKKSITTKEKIGIKKKENWKDLQLSSKMYYGLGKATQKWIKICKEERIKKESVFNEYHCSLCGKSFLVPITQYYKPKYCSPLCVNKDKKIPKSAVINKQLAYEKQNKEIIHFVEKWALNNKDIILNCPLNKIETSLSSLFKLASESFNLKDTRSIAYSCYRTRSKKVFLKQLKSFCENIC